MHKTNYNLLFRGDISIIILKRVANSTVSNSNCYLVGVTSYLLLTNRKRVKNDELEKLRYGITRSMALRCLSFHSNSRI